MNTFSLDQLVEKLGGAVQGDGSVKIQSIATLKNAQPGQITFLTNSKYKAQLSDTQASAVIVNEQDAEDCPVTAWIHPNPYVAYAKLAQVLDTTPKPSQGVAPSAFVHPSAQLGNGVTVGPNAVVEAEAMIGDGTSIGAGAVVGQGVKIGEDCKIWANVSLYHRVQIGARCILHAGAVIGSDGFGFANEGGQWVKIPQTGSVIVGDDTEIGANTTVDRGALDDTVIGSNVIIDNQCQIAHNAIIGDHSAIAGCTVIAGSANIGHHCIIGGASAVNGHLTIAPGTNITGFSMVTKAIDEPGLYSSGMPATTNKEWRRSIARLRQLDSLSKKIKSLEATISSLPDKHNEG